MAEPTDRSGSDGNLALAILFACLAPVIAVAFLDVMIGHGRPDTGGLMLVGAIAAMAASVGVVLVGLPVHVFLQHKNWTSYPHYIAAGLISGVALSLLSSRTLELGPYGLNFYGFCHFTVPSAVGLRMGWGKP